MDILNSPAEASERVLVEKTKKLRKRSGGQKAKKDSNKLTDIISEQENDDEELYHRKQSGESLPTEPDH